MYQCVNPVFLLNELHDRYEPVPCGNCYPCQMRKRAEWDFRLYIEYLYSAFTAFVTYTYEDDFLCIAHSYREFQLLHKRMRNDGLKFSFYHVSEFGELRGRPHNHELVFIKSAPSGFTPLELYAYQQYGIMDVGTVTRASIHYVTKWHVHPKYRIGESIEQHGFTRQSKGLGADYLYGLDCDNIQPVISLDGDLFPTPRYYRKKVGYLCDDFVWTSPFETWHARTGMSRSVYDWRRVDLISKSLNDQHVISLRKLE